MNRQPVVVMSSYYHPQHLVTYTQHYQPQWFDNPDLAACFGYGLMQHGGGGGSEGDGHARTAGQHLDQAPDLHPPDFRAPPTRPFHVRQQARQLRQRPPPSMAAFNAITDEEMAEMQKRSNEYEPEATVRVINSRVLGRGSFYLHIPSFYLTFADCHSDRDRSLVIASPARPSRPSTRWVTLTLYFKRRRE